MAAIPVRVRRSRAKGSKLESPNELPVVCVSRGTRWGNPYVVDDRKPGSREASMAHYRRDLERGKLGFSESDVRRDLAGKNLACWCHLDQACHADILLEIANSPGATVRPADRAPRGAPAGSARRPRRLVRDRAAAGT